MILARKNPTDGDNEGLSQEQVKAYNNQGFLLVSGLVDPRTIDLAATRLSSLLAASGTPHIAFYSDKELLACYTQKLCYAAAQLAGVRRLFQAPHSTSTVSAWPTTEAWRWPHPHIDHSRKEDGYRTFPPPYRVGCIIYLTPAKSHSGATVVWPGSHRLLEYLAAENPERYEYLWCVNRDLPVADLGNPIELIADSGDVLFHHYLCAHSGSGNTSENPRLALNHKW